MRLQDYTELEFLNFLRELYSGEGSEAELDKMISHFDEIIGHPLGSDLIIEVNPDVIEDQSPEGVIAFIKEWRISQGLPGFKE